MTLSCTQVDNLTVATHRYLALCPDGDDNWLSEIASEYIKLRTECAAPIEAISLEGIQVLDVDEIGRRIRRATVSTSRSPNPRVRHMDTIRSDFGETLAYMLNEQLFGTAIGYKSIRDRETILMPGRGIDIVGVEDDARLTLILGETKVSDESASPPGVVDRGDDCLRNQHREHLRDINATVAKIWNLSRQVTDINVRAHYWRAAFHLETGNWRAIDVIVCCVLIRPQKKYGTTDFGSFYTNAQDYAPARVRFLVACVPNDIEPIIQEWCAIIDAMEAQK